MKKLLTLLALAFCLNAGAQCTPPSAPVLTATTSVNNASCQGSPPVLTVNSGTNVAVWYSGNTWLYTGSSYAPPASLTPGTYTYSVIDSIPVVGGCVNAPPSANTLTLSLTVNPLPLPIATSNTPCSSQQALNLNCTPNGMVNYDWVGPNSFSTSVQNPVISNVSGVNAGIYTVTVTDVNGCTNTATVNVVINPLPVITVNSPTVCENQTINLTASTSGGDAYSWSGPNIYTSASQNPSIPNATPAMAGLYVVTVTDANGCSNENSAQVVVRPLPFVYITDTVLCPGSTTTLTANGANTYTWSTGANTASIVPSVIGSYSVIGTDINGCSDSTSTNLVSIGCTSIEQFANNKEQLNIYPNPNNGLFNLSISQFNNLKMSSIEIYNVAGECVHRQIATSANCQMDLSSLNEGVYNISITGGGGVVNKRLVIVR